MTEAKKELWNSPGLGSIQGYQCPHCGSSNLKKFLGTEEQWALAVGGVVCKSQGEHPDEPKGVLLSKVLCGDCWMASCIALKD